MKLARHKSLITSKTIGRRMRKLEARDDVRKIAVGASRGCRVGLPVGTLNPKRIVNGSLLVEAIGENGVTDVWITCDDPEKLKEELTTC